MKAGDVHWRPVTRGGRSGRGAVTVRRYVRAGLAGPGKSTDPRQGGEARVRHGTSGPWGG
ncbi:hypothetical protein GCM10010495_24780 [Kitasatospora herbaricolor]|nr:hypothetical protein GCM10010495_24780 [Kitasatospora herbaricolor]